MAKPIGTLGTIPTLTVGGWVFTDLDNLIQLYSSMSAQKYWAMVAPNGTGPYQVTVSTTLKIYAAQICNVAQSDSISALLYGDDVANNSNTPPTNAVYQGDFGTTFSGFGFFAAAAGVHSFITRFDIPSQKYPHVIQNNGAAAIAGVTVFGYEV